MVTQLTVDAPDGAAEAFLAGEEGRPGVLFFMDAIGLRPRIAEMAQRIADWGYVVLAPNVFHREGRVDDLAPKHDLMEPGAREAFFEKAMPRVHALTRWPPSATAWAPGSPYAPPAWTSRWPRSAASTAGDW